MSCALVSVLALVALIQVNGMSCALVSGNIHAATPRGTSTRNFMVPREKVKSQKTAALKKFTIPQRAAEGLLYRDGTLWRQGSSRKLIKVVTSGILQDLYWLDGMSHQRSFEPHAPRGKRMAQTNQAKAEF
jgi:hypothetical protein